MSNIKKFYPSRKTIFLSILLFFGFLLTITALAQNTTQSQNNSASALSIPDDLKSSPYLNDLLKGISFLNIKEGDTINSNFNIKVKLPYIQNIQASLMPVNSNKSKFTGQATKMEGDYWSISFSSQNIPDGAYYLSAKIESSYGNFESVKTKINVDNSKSNGSKELNQSYIDEWEKKMGASSGKNYQEEVDKFLDSLLTPEWLTRYFGVAVCSSENLCGAQADPDKDELTNIEEFRFGTDPLNPDTDGDGYPDGNEIQNWYDPLKSSPGHKDDKMTFDDPKENGILNASIFKVLNVSTVSVSSQKTGLSIKGTGLPKGFVNVYVYSSLPIIFTVKTNDDGTWSYVLDKDIEDGEHQIYVAVTDNTGKIMAKSEPLFFVKTAEAVSVVLPSGASGAQQVAPPAEKRKVSYFIIAIIIATIAFLIALLIIGIKISSGSNKKPGKF